MTNLVVDKSTDNAEPLSICFLPQYSTSKKVFISERDQNHDAKKEQPLSILHCVTNWREYDANSVVQTSIVQTLIDNDKLANQIARLQATVVKVRQRYKTMKVFWIYKKPLFILTFVTLFTNPSLQARALTSHVITVFCWILTALTQIWTSCTKFPFWANFKEKERIHSSTRRSLRGRPKADHVENSLKWRFHRSQIWLFATCLSRSSWLDYVSVGHTTCTSLYIFPRKVIGKAYPDFPIYTHSTSLFRITAFSDRIRSKKVSSHVIFICSKS